jgi:NADPH-dependent glutamate synthase beta subunit-like oxidoreductase/formate hydrogenlyase subunit 6/NADH:ubiquinone oxidoreductase subunit I
MGRKWVSRKWLIEKWQYLHRTAQFLFLGLFLYLFIGLGTGTSLSIPANLFFRFDPLLALSSMLASRRFILVFIPALIILLITLVLGRVWCGWVCPLGTILDLYGYRGRKNIPRWIRQIKYFVLSFILIVAIFSILPLNFLDPLTIFLRGLSGIKQLFVVPSSGWLILTLPFMVILALNLFTRRAWCRYLCPLGGLLGLISKVAWFKRRVERMDQVTPCKLDCPAGTNVAGYVALISQGRFKEAVGLIKEVNPFPAVCGHVCPHLCEENCNRGEFDHPIAINDLGRVAAEHVLRSGHARCKPTKITKKEKIATIGSGPASLTAAFHLRRMGYYVKVFEKLSMPGGMLAVGIPRYRLPREVLQKEIDYIKGIGVEIETNVEIDKPKFEQIRKEYDAVFVSVGSHKSQKLGVEGEDLEGVIHGVDFLRDLNLEKEVKIEDKVAVIGGGDVAIDTARCALRLGSEVTIFYRRSEKEMPAREEEVEEAEEEGVEIKYLVTPTKIIGEDGKVTGIECVRVKLGAPDESGRRRPILIDGSEFIADVDMVIPAISQSSDLACLKDTGIETLKGNRIKTDKNYMTTLSGVFAGGDAVTGPATVIEAVGMGRRAAISIDRYLRDRPFPEHEEKKVIRFKDIPEEKVPKERKERKKTSKISIERRRNSFDEVAVGFTCGEAVEEAERCLNWSCAECASCARRCPMGAINEKDFNSDPGECLQCLECLPCPAGTISFRGKLIKADGYEFNLSRRQFLASGVIGVTGGLLSHLALFRKRSSHLLRPPGARPEADFLSQCVRCGQCLEVCPQDALQPAFLESGWEGILTPRLVPRKGFCDPNCNACGQVCPTGAIPSLSLEEKRTQVIGTAHLDLSRCELCLICRDMCPQRAIEVVEVEKGGEIIRLLQIVPENCTGCGLCEYICPVEGEAAIRVRAPADSTNQSRCAMV